MSDRTRSTPVQLGVFPCLLTVVLWSNMFRCRPFMSYVMTSYESDVVIQSSELEMDSVAKTFSEVHRYRGRTTDQCSCVFPLPLLIRVVHLLTIPKELSHGFKFKRYRKIHTLASCNGFASAVFNTNRMVAYDKIICSPGELSFPQISISFQKSCL